MKVVRLCIVLGVLQVLLVLASWLVSAVMPDTSMRSLLSPEGIRWFFGHFTENMAQPLLVWIVLLYVAFNAYRRAGLQHAMSLLLEGRAADAPPAFRPVARPHRRGSYRGRHHDAHRPAQSPFGQRHGQSFPLQFLLSLHSHRGLSRFHREHHLCHGYRPVPKVPKALSKPFRPLASSLHSLHAVLPESPLCPWLLVMSSLNPR